VQRIRITIWPTSGRSNPWPGTHGFCTRCRRGRRVHAGEPVPDRIDLAVGGPASRDSVSRRARLPSIDSRPAFRPKPNPSKSGFEAPGSTAEEIYRQAWRLNVLWLITFYGLIILNVSDKPNSFPDAILGNRIVVFGVWHAVQKNSLSTPGEWITLFTDLRKQKLSRMMNSLPQGLKKGAPRFWSYLILGGAIRLAIGIFLVEALWPWLSGKANGCGLHPCGGKYRCVRDHHSLVELHQGVQPRGSPVDSGGDGDVEVALCVSVVT
jgi:hypothetical protein